MARPIVLLAIAALAIAVLSAAPVDATSGAVRRLLAPDAPLGVWPPKFKCDRDAGHSPLQLLADEPATEGKFHKFCFTVADDLACNAAFSCCNKTLPVHKILLQVDPRCKGSVRKVTVDGVVDPGYEFNAAEKYLRVSDVSVGDKICVYVADNAFCQTRDQLCGLEGGGCRYSIFTKDCDCCPVRDVEVPVPPPFEPGKRLPPPPPGSFPDCACNKSTDATKYIVGTPIETINATSGINKACFTITTTDTCILEGSCCSFDLHKFEIEVPSYCSTSVLHFTVDGKFKPKSVVTKPYSAAKVTGIAKKFADADDTEICVFLKGRCSRLSQLCPGGGGCQVAVFNNKLGTTDSCCPVYQLPA